MASLHFYNRNRKFDGFNHSTETFPSKFNQAQADDESESDAAQEYANPRVSSDDDEGQSGE